MCIRDSLHPSDQHQHHQNPERYAAGAVQVAFVLQFSRRLVPRGGKPPPDLLQPRDLLVRIVPAEPRRCFAKDIACRLIQSGLVARFAQRRAPVVAERQAVRLPQPCLLYTSRCV